LSHKYGLNIKLANGIRFTGGADGPAGVFFSGVSFSRWFAVVFAILTILGLFYLAINKLKARQN